MNTWLIAFLIGNVIGLTFLVLKQQSTISSMKEYIEDKMYRLLVVDDKVRKIETAFDWLIERKGMKVDRGITSSGWSIMPIQQQHELDYWWKHIQVHREEIVYALYEATKRALEDHDKKKTNKRGK